VNVLKPNKRATILTLLERGTSQREIARITGIDRKTVRRYRDRWLAEQA
jgi:DNA-binding NarL/FixJ family response regulator